MYYIKKLKSYTVSIILIFFIFNIFFLSDTTTYCFDEAYYMGTSMNMVNSGNYFIPQYEGKVRFQKPILFYLFISLIYKIFGISIFNARLVSLIFGLLTGFLIFKIASLLFNNKKSKFYAVISYFSLYSTFIYSRCAITDMCLTFFIILSIYYFLKLYFTNERKYSLLSMGAMGAGTLIKGYIGFILPLTVILAFCLIMMKKNFLNKFIKLFTFPSIITFLIIGVSWYLYMYIIYGNAYLYYIIGYETVHRISHQLINIKNIHYYSIAFLRHLFPFSILFPGLFLFKKERDKLLCHENRKEILFLFIWILLILILFIFFIQEHHSRYILSIVVPFSLLIGNYLSIIENKWLLKCINWVIFISISVVIFLSLLIIDGILVFELKSIDIPCHFYKLYILFFILFLGLLFLIYSTIKQKFKLQVITITLTFILTYSIIIGLIIPDINPKPINLFIKNEFKKIKKDDLLITNNLKTPDRWRITIYRKKDIDKFFENSDINEIVKYLQEIKTEKRKIYFITDMKTFKKFPEEIKEKFGLIMSAFKYRRNINVKKFFKEIKKDKKNIEKFREYYGMFIYEG